MSEQEYGSDVERVMRNIETRAVLIQKFCDLADHLGCDPADLAGVDLVRWHQVIVLANDAIEGTAEWAQMEDMAEQILAQLPERKTNG